MGVMTMAEIKFSVSDDFKKLINQRTAKLNISNAEYFRTLAGLDISLERYQLLIKHLDYLYEKINNYHQMLGIYSTPLRDVVIHS